MPEQNPAVIVSNHGGRTLSSPTGPPVEAGEQAGPSSTRFPLREVLRGRVAHTVAILALVALITMLAWPFVDIPPVPGLDRSWQTGLHLATWAHLRQGVDVVFTYGPLGFLAVPRPYLGWTTLLALLATGAVYFGLIAALLVEARRVLPMSAAALVVLGIGRAFAGLPPFEAFQALILLACIEVLAGRIRLPASAIASSLGIAAAVAILGKLNIGVFIAAMGFVTALAIDRRWWRGIVVFGVAAVASGIGLWVLTGQRLGDIPAYASGSIQIVSGYSEAMGLDLDPAVLWIYLAFIGIAGMVGWMAFRMSAIWPRHLRLGLFVVLLIIGFAMWKTAFVRGFPTYVFATLLAASAVVAAPLRDRRLWLTSLLAVAVAFMGVAKITLPPTPTSEDPFAPS